PVRRKVVVSPPSSTAEEAPKRTRVAAMLAGLSADERRNLEAEALLKAKPFVAATYERLKKEGGILFDEVRNPILLQHLKELGLEEEAVAMDTATRATA